MQASEKAAQDRKFNRCHYQPPAPVAIIPKPTLSIGGYPCNSLSLRLVQNIGQVTPPSGKWADLEALLPVRVFKARYASTLLPFGAVVDAIGQIEAKQKEAAHG